MRQCERKRLKGSAPTPALLLLIGLGDALLASGVLAFLASALLKGGAPTFGLLFVGAKRLRRRSFA